MCLDRAGLVGEDGATHQGGVRYRLYAFDSGHYRRGADGRGRTAELDVYGFARRGPFVIRYPRGAGVRSDWRQPFREIPVGRGRWLRDGTGCGGAVVGACGEYGSRSGGTGLGRWRFGRPHRSAFRQTAGCDLFARGRQAFRADRRRRRRNRYGGSRIGRAGIYECVRLQTAGGNCSGFPTIFIGRARRNSWRRICGFDLEGIYRTIMKSKK